MIHLRGMQSYLPSAGKGKSEDEVEKVDNPAEESMEKRAQIPNFGKRKRKSSSKRSLASRPPAPAPAPSAPPMRESMSMGKSMGRGFPMTMHKRMPPSPPKRR